MTPEERLNLAADLIRKKEYASARAILVTLDHPKAHEWLTRLDQMNAPKPYNPPSAPISPTVVVREKQGGGCLTAINTAIAGLRLIWILALSGLLFIFCCGSIVGIVLVLRAINEPSQRAIEANNGYGTKDNPIPLETWAKYDGGQLRLARSILDITQGVNDASVDSFFHPGDRRYTLLYVELVCQQQECGGNNFRVSYVDSAGDEWDESSIYGLPDVGPTERLQHVYRNGTTAGWVHVDFPPTVTALRWIKISWGYTQTLYFKVPPIEVLDS